MTEAKDIHRFRDGDIVVFRRPRSSRWQARIRVPGGGWRRVTTRVRDLEAARRAAEAVLDKMRAREHLGFVPVARSFEEVAKIAEAEMRSEIERGRGRVVFEHYIGAIHNYLVPFFGRMPIDGIRPRHMSEFERWRADKMGKEPSASTAATHSSAFNRIYDVALREEAVRPYHVPQMKNPKRAESIRRPAFTEDEVRQMTWILNKWATSQLVEKSKAGARIRERRATERTRQIREFLADYVFVLLHTGIRHATEAQSLIWRNVEERAKDGRVYTVLKVKGKMGRWRPLVAEHLVAGYLARFRSRLPQAGPDDPVLRLPDGTWPADLHGAFETFLTQHGLLYDGEGRRRTLYSCRHTYATLQIMSERVDLHRLALNMGTSIAMLERHYSHLDVWMARRALAGRTAEEELDEFWGPGEVDDPGEEVPPEDWPEGADSDVQAPDPPPPLPAPPPSGRPASFSKPRRTSPPSGKRHWRS
jgi:integrase